MKDDYNPYDHLAWLEANLIKQSEVIEEMADLMAKIAERQQQHSTELENFSIVMAQLLLSIEQLENNDEGTTGSIIKKIH